MGKARDMEAACRAIVVRHASAWGVPEAVDDIDLETIEKRNGAWVTNIKRINTTSGYDETEDLEFVVGTTTPDRESRRIIALKTFGAIRNRLRHRALEQAGEDHDARPAWSLTLPRVQIAVLRMLGIDPAEHLPDVRKLRDALSAAGWIGSFVMTDGDFCSPYMALNGPVRMAITWDDRTRIRLTGANLPDTMVQGLAGRDLNDIVSLDLDMRAGPVRVTRSEISRGVPGEVEIDLWIPPQRVTLAPVPRGIDRSWLKVPWIPRTPAF